MKIYFNEEAAIQPKDEGYTRGIPSEYEEILELADSRQPLDVESEDTGMIQEMVDGEVYGILEKQENPFRDYILEFGRYDRESKILEDVTWIQQKHIQDTARVVKIGTEKFKRLLEIRTRIMGDEWDSKIIDMSDIELDDYTPIH